MKQRFFLILCFLLPLFGNAQDGLRDWRKGPLTWNDFKAATPDSLGVEHSYLEFFLYIDELPEEHDGVNYWMKNARACIDRQRSWADSSSRTPEELHYNQVIFNLVELYRRYIQIEIDTGGSPDMDYYMQLLATDVDTFCYLSDFGRDTAEVNRWDAYVHSQMTAAAAVTAETHAEHIKQTTDAGSYATTNRFGFGIGAGLKMPAGNLHQYFRTGGGFYMDCEFGYSRQLLNFGLYIGGSRCLDTLWHKTKEINDLYTKDPLTVIGLKFDYGIAVIDNNRLRLTPFVGIGMLGLYTEISDDFDETTSVGPTAFSWRAGVDFRYHFSTDITRYQRSCEVSQFSLFAKLYVEPARFRSVFSEPHGVTVNLAVGLAFHEISRVLR